MEDKSFLGKGWNFPPQFNKKSNVTQMVKEDEDIKQSLNILLNTSPGERIHRFDFGCNIKRYVYEPMILTNQTIIKEDLEKSILLFEPRISLNYISIDMSSEKEGIMYINIDYTVLKTNKRSNMVYPFYLREGTDIEK